MKKKIRLRELKLKKLRFKRLRYRTLLIGLGIIATVLLAFNFWFIDHAEEALEQIVYRQSKGKLKLKVAKFKFNWITNKIELERAAIFSTDTVVSNSYAIDTRLISIKARGFLPLLFNREILIDSIRLRSPNVIFTRNQARKAKDTVNNDPNTFSVAEEMGRIANSLTDVINVLKIDRFLLDNGSFSLIDKTRPRETPFAVSNISIQLDNLQVDSTIASKKGKQKITFTDNIAIRTYDQRIAFPGGRHFIAFKDFRVNLQNRRVEFDSCTLRAVKGDSSRTAFRIFFDKLQLTNINFDSLYSSETIIADSVFCNRPQIFLDIDSDRRARKKKSTKVGMEKVDEVIQQLLGDLKLGYVGVKSANINVSTIKKGKASTFSSQNNNFEMYGLTVRQSADRPISLDKFAMSLHNYENVLRDGRYAIAFDSIRFENDIINLSKFKFKEFEHGKTIKSLSMPSFQVRGLSWEALLYDNMFSAQTAVFYDPLVDYSLNNKNKKSKPKSLFETLNNIDDVMDLKNLGVYRGNITLHFKKGASLQLTNTNLDLRANDFTRASQIKNVQRSVNLLSFDKGIFKKGSLTALLNNVRLSENKSGITASTLQLTSHNLKADAQTIHIGNVVLDSASQSILVDGVTWQKANVVMPEPRDAGVSQKVKKKATAFVLRNIKGRNTEVQLAIGPNKVSGYFNTLLLQEFSKNASGKPEVRGLSLDGRQLNFLGPDLNVTARKLDIKDKTHSVIEDIRVEKINTIDSIIAVIPRLTIIPNITEVVNGSLVLQGLVLSEPVVTAKLGRKDTLQKANIKKAATVEIQSALLERPNINIAITNRSDSNSYISWNGVANNSYLKISGLQSTPALPLKADQIKMFLTNFEFITAKNRRYATNDNKLNVELNDVQLAKSGDKMEWRTLLNILSIDKLSFDSLGGKNTVLELDKGDVRNVALNSKYINSIGDIITSSPHLTINGTNGKLTTGKNRLQWFGFTVKDRRFGVDSLSLVPHQSVEEYRIAKAYNEDYLKIRTGKIAGGPVDLEKYNNDSILSIGEIALHDVDLFTFKDKTQPDTAKRYKPLPAEMLLKLKSSLSIDSVRLHNMHVTYGEVNPGTDTLGMIAVSDLNALISNIKNYGIAPDDSIYIVASANVLDRLHTTLDVSQSYTDTTGYMRMNLSTGPMDLTKFNTVLVPLVGAKVFDGQLQALHVNAIGNNDAATGTARMYYRGLKIGLLDKKNLPEQTFLNKLVSSVAMAFVIRKNNRGKESLVFFERWQDKSPINYIIKTTLEGIKSGIGLPGAKKKLRKYNKKTAGQSK